ncbi:MAG: CPBP family intramembrane metalloprotease [Planctomycetes bacterium]|nr:CPBP family intramembrane metalloprotease [Planctomycetota bacterium]
MKRFAGIGADQIRWNGIDVLFIFSLHYSLQFLFQIVPLSLGRSLLLHLLEPGSPGLVSVLTFWIEKGLESPDSIPPVLPLYFGGVAAGVLTLELALVVVLQFSESPPAALGWRSFPAWKTVLAILLMFMAFQAPLFLITYGWDWLLVRFGHQPELQEQVQIFKEALEGRDLALLGVLAAGAVLVAPLVEELLFRGILYGFLRKRLGMAWGGALSSLAFSGVHTNLAALAPIFALGWLLCLIYEWRGSLFDAILFHAVFNSATLLWTAFWCGGP